MVHSRRMPQEVQEPTVAAVARSAAAPQATVTNCAAAAAAGGAGAANLAWSAAGFAVAVLVPALCFHYLPETAAAVVMIVNHSHLLPC